VSYIVNLQPPKDDVTTVLNRFQSDNAFGLVLLLRGLIAQGILAFALQKRWRVGYGRAGSDRRPPTGLAVPYRAKDAPAPRSEFSHPDVVITLTCLTYYYAGLTDDELFNALERLSVRGIDGDQEYQTWVASAPPSFPVALRRLAAINIRDRDMCISSVFPYLRYSKPAIDYYLSEILFAKEMREFPQKLTESGWSFAERRSQPTTGFSGTNDAKDLLPLGIESLPLVQQRHTDAAVLNRLLRPENEVHNLNDAEDLLRRFASVKPPIRVILDVGAQIIELDNLEIARTWLNLVSPTDASAAIFFDDNDEICVVTRDGTIEPFLGSTYATNTSACLVFLDQVHTRGTDLPLPDHYRAAVTLGPGLPKSQLVQGNITHPMDTHTYDNIIPSR
jgi:hypothetical protein